MSRLRISGALLVTLAVLFLTGATFQQAGAARPDPEMMGLLSRPVPLADVESTVPVQAQAAGAPRWTNWATIGGMYTTSAPSVAAAGQNQVYLFARSERGSLIWQRWNGTRWSGWEDIGSGVRIGSAPSCTSWGTPRSVRLSCFAVLEGSSSLSHKWYDGTSWSGWENLGGTVTSAAAAVSWSPGLVSAFVRGTDARMYQKYYDGRRWSGWVRHEGVLTSAPACASWGEARVDCVVRGEGNSLFYMFWDGARWNAWANLGGGVNSAPTIAAWGVSRLSVFYRGDNGMMMHRYWDGARWVGPEDLGGPISSSPSCTSPVVNRIECYAQGIDPAYNAGPELVQRIWATQ